MPASIYDVRISRTADLVSPQEVRRQYPVTDSTVDLVRSARAEVEAILRGVDSRLLVICGPCSVHDPEAGLEYAQRLRELRDTHSEHLLIVMRVYFEKPRTRGGWKGLINDPNLDGTFDIDQGIRRARKILCDIAELGLPTATEFLDPVTPQYIAELVTWGCIGARTVESQVHREMASGLSCPVGFKNTTRGEVREAVDAIVSAQQSHTFMSVTDEGRVAVLESKGNDCCHLVMRGGNKPNYDRESLEEAALLLRDASLPERMLVDISHANSRKDPSRQPMVMADLCNQLLQDGQPHLMGLMVESFLVAGRQNITDHPLTYGQSITDACMGWEETVAAVRQLAEACAQAR